MKNFDAINDALDVEAFDCACGGNSKTSSETQRKG